MEAAQQGAYLGAVDPTVAPAPPHVDPACGNAGSGPKVAAFPAPLLPMASPKASTGSRDPRVDEYIARAAPFARAPMEHVREAMHAALPDVTEAIKWSHPFFLLDEIGRAHV